MSSKVAVKERPRTIDDVLGAIEKCLVSTTSLPMLREDLAELSNCLLEICQDDMAKARNLVIQRGKPWEGEVHINGDLKEQDGISWSLREEVLVGTELRYIGVASEGCWEVEERERIEFVMSKDEKFLWELCHRVSKTFREDGRKGEVVLFEISVELKDNRIVHVAVIRNIDTPPSERGSLYYIPTNAVIRHELVLPT